MNIVLASSDLYSKLEIVTIKSLLMNNMASEQISIYYVGDKLSHDSISELTALVKEYHREITFLTMPDHFANLSGSNRNGQTVFCYCFFQDILPQTVDKVLLLEGDTIITGSLEELYNTDIEEQYIAAADDLQSKWYKRKLGMNDFSPYVNCGVVLYNLKKWREDNLSKRIASLLKSGKCMFFYDVQDVINCVAEGKVKVLSPKFNCTTAIFLFDYEDMIRYRRPSTHCTREDFDYAREHPVIIHFTKNQVMQPRPWIENCQHPFKDYYLFVKSHTSQNKTELWEYHPDLINKFANLMYRKMPKRMTAVILGFVHSYLYPKILYKVLFKTK